MVTPSTNLFDMPNKMPPSTGYYETNTYPFYEQPHPKTSKYSELYIPTVPSTNYPMGGSIDVYPVDTLNMIPSTVPGPSQKRELAESSGGFQKGASATSSTSDFENIFGNGKFDFDFTSLLTSATPANKESMIQQDSYLIPDAQLDFLAEPVQPTLDPFELTNNSPASLSTSQTGIDFLQGISKDTPVDFAKVPLSQESSTPVGDPFMSGLNGDESIVDFPADESRFYPTRTPSVDFLASDYSPPQSSQPSPINETSPQIAGPNTWGGDSLQELFEKTFDLSDIDMNFILPPPPKRLHTDTPTPIEETNYVPSNPSLASSPAPSEVALQASPVSPNTKPVISRSPDPVDAVSEKGGGKAKSAMLFGKHEDEILHKMLIPQPGENSKPITRDKLISMPVEEFNHLLELVSLTEIEVAFMKEWRRRGKNKVAAQIARKRKREEVTDLDVEVNALRLQKVELEKKYDRLRSVITTLKERSLKAEEKVYQRQRKLTGKPVSRETHLIHVTEDEKLLLVPRISSQILMVNK